MPRSKFSTIVKIRKQKCDEIERELLQSRAKERMLKSKISRLYEEILKVDSPKEGKVSLLILTNEQKRILNLEKKQCEQDLRVAKSSTKKFQEAYKKAHMEYEKIKYLEEQELLALMQKIKKEEQLYLDEVATMLFAGDTSKRGEK